VTANPATWVFHTARRDSADLSQVFDYLLRTAPRLVHTNEYQSIQPGVAVDTLDRVHVIWMDGTWGTGIPWLPWTITYARRGTGGNWAQAAVLGQGSCLPTVECQARLRRWEA